MRIGVIRTSALGDSVLATPALRALHLRHPDAELHFITNESLAPIFEGLPFLTKVWPWRMGGGHRTIRGIPAFAANLRSAGPFDLLVDLQNSIATRVLARSLRSGRILRFVKRRGFRAVASSIVGEGPILDELPAAALFLGAIEGEVGPSSSWDLTPIIQVAAEAKSEAAALLASAEQRKIVALAPGARWATKRWGVERFVEVGDSLAAAGASIVLVGGPGDRAQLQAVREGLKEPPLGDTEQLGIPALAAVIERADLLITCDSAPSHLAQAVGTPVVAVFGPTSPRRWGPLPGKGAAVSLPIACAPCTNFGKRPCFLGHHACMVDLGAAPVIAAAEAALRGGRERGGQQAQEASQLGRTALALQVARSRRQVR